MTKTARLETRLPPSVLANIKRAAEIQGRSVSDFVSTAAQDAAQKVITETEIITLSREAQERFVQMLIDPPEPSAGLRKAFKRHKVLIKS